MLFEVLIQCTQNTERRTKKSGLNPHLKPKINLCGSFSASCNHGLISNWGDHNKSINLNVIMKHLITVYSLQNEI